MWDLRTFWRNARLADKLGVAYTAADHAAYKQELRRQGLPVVSVTQALTRDVYDQGLVGPCGEPLVVGDVVLDEDVMDGSEQKKIALQNDVIAQAKKDKRFAKTQKTVSAYVGALALATRETILPHVDIQLATINHVGGAVSVVEYQAYPKAEIYCEDKSVIAPWNRGKGHGWKKGGPDTVMFGQNHKFAAYLGIRYDDKTHAAYKKNLEALNVPQKSLPYVILSDTYNKGLVGFSAGPLASTTLESVRENKGADARNKEIESVMPGLIEQAKDTKRFVQLKTTMDTYLYAFNHATEEDVTMDLKVTGVGIVDKKSPDVLGAFAVAHLYHDNIDFYPCWFNPKGYGWHYSV